MNLNTIHNGESLAWLKTLPDGIADGIVTDPPYSSGGQYRSDRTQKTNTKYLNTDNEGLYASFSGDNRDQRSFHYWCTLWLSEALRITKPGGVICCFTDWRQLPTTTDAVQAGGWVWRGVWVWDKTEAVRPVLGRFRSQCEYVVWGSNGAMPIDKTKGAIPGVCRQQIKPKEKLHTTGKPLEVMKEILRIVPEGGLIVDPFAGSGTTLLAAKHTSRQYLGCELSEHYHAIASKRLKQDYIAMKNIKDTNQKNLFE
jgi:site-specific DNA-methyltransferase (adenine-specific)